MARVERQHRHTAVCIHVYIRPVLPRSWRTLKFIILSARPPWVSDRHNAPLLWVALFSILFGNDTDIYHTSATYRGTPLPTVPSFPFCVFL